MSEYRLYFEEQSREHWAKLLSEIHKDGGFEINGFALEKDPTYENLLEEFSNLKKASVRVYSSMGAVMLSPEDYEPIRLELERSLPNFNPNDQDFEKIRSHINGWYDSFIQPFITGEFQQTYTFPEFTLMIMNIGKTMRHFKMFVSGDENIYACGVFEREPEKLYNKTVTLYPTGYNNCGSKIVFDIDDGFCNTYGNSLGDKINAINQEWKSLDFTQKSLQKIKSIYLDFVKDRLEMK